uniref:tRNA N(3)-methylcytidine methyltransferase n=1 Tax=Aceria tosichella TaxID=561515 RepID=A0A6G1S8L3_9ACAR
MSDDSQEERITVQDHDKQPSIKLSIEDQHRLKCPPGISDFQRENLEKNAKKNWDLFYKRHGNRFFKKRYWTRREFAELFSDGQEGTDKRYLLEIGCGCGDFALPLLDNEPDKYDDDSLAHVSLAKDLFIYCCDISERAIEILKSNDIYKRFETSRIRAFVGNLLDRDGIVSNLGTHKMNYISLIFVLSALDPRRMELAIENISSLISPGGLVFFRDYAIYDEAMLRFNEKSKIQNQFYVRQDGTRAYFFTKSELIGLFSKENFECDTIEYVRRETINSASGKHLSRIFLQAKFRKRTS